MLLLIPRYSLRKRHKSYKELAVKKTNKEVVKKEEVKEPIWFNKKIDLNKEADIRALPDTCRGAVHHPGRPAAQGSSTTRLQCRGGGLEVYSKLKYRIIFLLHVKVISIVVCLSYPN